MKDNVEQGDQLRRMHGWYCRRNLQKDSLTIVKKVFEEFMALVSMRRGDNEGFETFEQRLQAQVSKLNSHFVETAFPEALLAFLLIGNSNVDHSQRMSILEATALSSLQVKLADHSKGALNLVSYESVASIIHQCERKKLSAGTHPLQTNAAYPRSHRLTPTELQKRKNKF